MAGWGWAGSTRKDTSDFQPMRKQLAQIKVRVPHVNSRVVPRTSEITECIRCPTRRSQGISSLRPPAESRLPVLLQGVSPYLNTRLSLGTETFGGEHEKLKSAMPDRALKNVR